MDRVGDAVGRSLGRGLSSRVIGGVIFLFGCSARFWARRVEALGSSLKGRVRSRRGCGTCDRFSGRYRHGLGVRHPQPGSRRGARSAARTNGLEAGEDDAMLIQPGADRLSGGGVVGFRLHVRRRSVRRAGGSAAGHPFAARVAA